jgi:hypothetical protein
MATKSLEIDCPGHTKDDGTFFCNGCEVVPQSITYQRVGAVLAKAGMPRSKRVKMGSGRNAYMTHHHTGFTIETIQPFWGNEPRTIRVGAYSACDGIVTGRREADTTEMLALIAAALDDAQIPFEFGTGIWEGTLLVKEREAGF